MITLLKMPALFLGMLAVFCCLGSFFIRENRYESGHLGETVLFGFIAYYFLFELISVPMMVLGAKLHLLAWVWAAVVAVLVIASICLHLGMWREWGKKKRRFLERKDGGFLCDAGADWNPAVFCCCTAGKRQCGCSVLCGKCDNEPCDRFHQ